MSKKIQLQIPVPCHENWDKMSPVERGRFCSSCQKQVVDFSRMSDREIAMFFKKPSTGSVCGRFMTDQLNRDIELPKKRIPWVKYFFQFLLPGFLFSMRAKAQGEIRLVKDSSKVSCSSENKRGSLWPQQRSGNIFFTPKNTSVKIESFSSMIMGFTVIPLEKQEVVIKGKVVDEKNQSIPHAIINMPGTTFSQKVNVDGSFEIKQKSWTGELQLEANAAGYVSRKIQINPQHNSALIILIPVVQKRAEDTIRVMGRLDTHRVMKKNQRTKAIQNLDRPIIHKADIMQSPVKIEIPRSYLAEALTGVVGMVGIKRIDTKKEKPVKQLPPIHVNKPIAKEIINNKIKVYPNPARSNSTLHIEWTQNENGYHVLQLFNLQGQLVFSREIFIDDEAKLLSVDLPSLNSGSYLLTITNKLTSKPYTAKILVE